MTEKTIKMGQQGDMEGSATDSEVSRPNPGTSKPGFQYKTLKIIVNDMKEDGLVLYDSLYPVTSKLRRVGYCLTCERTLGSFVKIHEHKNKFPSHFKIFFNCKTCKQTIVGRDAFKLHREKHLKPRARSLQKKFECVICLKVYNDKPKLKAHVLRTHGKTRCEICKKTFTSTIYLRNHMKSHPQFVNGSGESVTKQCSVYSNPSKKKIYKCRSCSVCSETQTSLLLHVHKVHYMKLICEICRTQLKSEDLFKEHIKKHYVPTYTCALCEKEVLDLEYFRKQHLISEHGSLYQCRYCAKLFHSSSVFSFHYKFMHPADETFICKLCDDIFVTLDSKIRHDIWCQKTVHNPPAAPQDVKCSTCEKQFPSLESLQRHLLSLECQPIEGDQADFQLEGDLEIEVQPREEPWKKVKKPKEKKSSKSANIVGCDICEQTFSNKLKLAKHKWHKHSNVLLPDSTKESRGSLEEKNVERRNSGARKSIETSDDQFINTGESAPKVKKFSCLECGKKYWKGSALEAHIARRHAQPGSPRPSPFEQTLRPVQTTPPSTPSLQNQISINISPTNPIQNVCIPVVINSFAPTGNAGFVNGVSTVSIGVVGGPEVRYPSSAINHVNGAEVMVDLQHSTVNCGQSVQISNTDQSLIPVKAQSDMKLEPCFVHDSSINQDHLKLNVDESHENELKSGKKVEAGEIAAKSEAKQSASLIQLPVKMETFKKAAHNTHQCDIITPNDNEEDLQVISVEPGRLTENSTNALPLYVDCFICDKQFDRINKLLSHLRHNHN